VTIIVGTDRSTHGTREGVPSFVIRTNDKMRYSWGIVMYIPCLVNAAVCGVRVAHPVNRVRAQHDLILYSWDTNHHHPGQSTDKLQGYRQCGGLTASSSVSESHVGSRSDNTRTTFLRSFLTIFCRVRHIGVIVALQSVTCCHALFGKGNTRLRKASRSIT
jgi:hypothetical protein